MRYFSKLGLWGLGVRLNLNTESPFHDKPFFVVSNHLSYIDMLVLSSIVPTTFVTSIEIKNTPFLMSAAQLWMSISETYHVVNFEDNNEGCRGRLTAGN